MSNGLTRVVRYVGYKFYETAAEEGLIQYEDTVQYPFGYGLSYTDFKYNTCTLSDSIFSDKGKLMVNVEVENTGKREGQEVVQLYVRDMVSSISTPIQQLKAFKKINLKPGEKTMVSLELHICELAFYNAYMRKVVEPGEFEIQVGSSSDRIHFKNTIVVK